MQKRSGIEGRLDRYKLFLTFTGEAASIDQWHVVIEEPKGGTLLTDPSFEGPFSLNDAKLFAEQWARSDAQKQRIVIPYDHQPQWWSDENV